MQGTEKARLHFDSVDMPLRGRSDSRKIFAHEYIDDKATNPVKERAWIRRLRKAKAEKLIPAAIAVVSIFAAYGVIAALNPLF